MIPSPAQASGVRCRPVLLSLLFLASSAGTPAHGAARNLVVNGGFEEELVDGRIPGWTACAQMDRQRVWLDETEVHAGRRSLAIRVLESSAPGDRRGSQARLHQRVPVEPGRRYVFSIWFRRESALFGAFVHIQLFDEAGEPIPEALYRQNLRSRFWTSAQLSFDSGNARWAEIRILNNTVGTWRISFGQNLWVDEVSLIRLGEDGNRQEIDVAADGRSASGELAIAAPSRLIPWVALRAEGPHDLDLEIEGQAHRFRTYTHGEDTWVQPILPDLVVSAGVHPARITASGPGVTLRRVLFVQDPAWRPDDASDFLPPAETIERQNRQAATDSGTEPRDILLRVDGELPPGAWPVTQGVPFPRGVLRPADRVLIHDADSGEPVPSQAEPLMHWTDGSIRWIAVTLQAAAGQTFRLRHPVSETAVHPEPPSPVRITHDEHGIRIDTGPLRAFIPADGSRLLRTVTIDGRPVIDAAHLEINRRFSSDAGAVSVAIEEAGPLRAVIRLSGTHRDTDDAELLDYDLRWFFHAGSARVDVEHTFLHREDAVEIALEQVALHFDLPGNSVDRVRFPGEPAAEVNLRGGTVRLRSVLFETEDAPRAAYPFTVEQADLILAHGLRAPGQVRLEGPGGTWLAQVQDFWQNGPRSIDVAPARLSIGLVGPPGTPFYTGMAKTSRLTLALDGDSDTATAFLAEPLLLAPPAWYAETEATGHRFQPREDGAYEAYERCMEISFHRWPAGADASLFRREGAGLLHYGDHVNRRGEGNNLETARDEGALVQFLRTGDRDVYDYARMAIDHFIDIDIDHSHINGGLIWVHRRHDRDRADAGRAGINGHAWFNGVTHFEMLRASRRIIDVADRVGRYYSRHTFDLEPYVRPWRALAWQFMSVLQAYEVTGNTAYLEAARQSLRVTRHQRDFLIEEWPYMYAVGMKAVRQYYAATGDPQARELYLQLMDGFLRLRDRPEDTVNGEWRKPPGTVLGNFPNDRSCAFYNEAAWAYRLSGRRDYVDRAAFDLNWHTAFDVNDPTLPWGSADLLAAMAELGIGPVDASVEHPWVFMLPEQPPLNGDGEPEAGVALFHIEADVDRDFTLSLLKSAIFKYMTDHDGYAEVLSPSGRSVARLPVTNKGIGLYTLPVPADGETGVYTLRVEFEDLWRWTLEEAIVHLEPGLNYLLVDTRSARMGLDAFAVAPRGRFPWYEEDLPDIHLIEAEQAERTDDWEIFAHDRARGGSYIRRTGGRAAVRIPVQVDEGGEYRFFARVWYPQADVMEVQVEGANGDPVITGQVHDMARNAFPLLSVTSSLGADAVHRYWGDLTRETPPTAVYSPLYMGAGRALQSWLETWSISASDSRRVSVRPLDPQAPSDTARIPVRVTHRSGNRETSLGWDYGAEPGVDLARPHRVEFQWRADDLSAFEAGDLTWVRFFISGRAGRAGGDARWWAGALPRTDDGVFRLWLGDRSGATTGSIDTGIRLEAGQTYTFRVDIDPGRRSSTVRIDSGEESFTSPELPWRTSAVDGGGVLTLNTQAQAGNTADLAYSLLSFRVLPLTEDE